MWEMCEIARQVSSGLAALESENISKVMRRGILFGFAMWRQKRWKQQWFVNTFKWKGKCEQ